MMRILTALALAAASIAAHAETIDVNLSSTSLRGEFFAPFSKIQAQYNLGALIGEKRDSTLLAAHAGLLVTGDAGARQANVQAGLGGRFVVLDWAKVSGTALALGGMAEARLPAFNRLGVLGHLYWGPGAASFGDLEEYFEYAIAVDYQVIRNASIYLGYRQTKIEVEGGPDQTLDTGIHLGLRLTF
jgi:hypothetical protein